MNEAIEKELKLSKKQNKNDRYNYLCSQFNGIEYAIKLEKYTNKLLKENTQLKRMLNIKEKFDKKEVPYEWEFKDMFDMREENDTLKQQLKDKDEKISKVIDYCNEKLKWNRDDGNDYWAGKNNAEQQVSSDIKDILESNKED